MTAYGLPTLQDPESYEIRGRHVLRGSLAQAHFRKFHRAHPQGSRRKDVFRTYGPVLRDGICRPKSVALKRPPLQSRLGYL